MHPKPQFEMAGLPGAPVAPPEVAVLPGRVAMFLDGVVVVVVVDRVVVVDGVGAGVVVVVVVVDVPDDTVNKSQIK